jgi:hypothetical protein
MLHNRIIFELHTLAIVEMQLSLDGEPEHSCITELMCWRAAQMVARCKKESL